MFLCIHSFSHSSSSSYKKMKEEKQKQKTLFFAHEGELRAFFLLFFFTLEKKILPPLQRGLEPSLSITSQALWPPSYLARSLFKVPLAVPAFLHTPATAVLSHSSKLLLKSLSLLCLLWAALTLSQALDAVLDYIFCCRHLHWLTDVLREWGVERPGEREMRGWDIMYVCGGGVGIELDI